MSEEAHQDDEAYRAFQAERIEAAKEENLRWFRNLAQHDAVAQLEARLYAAKAAPKSIIGETRASLRARVAAINAQSDLDARVFGGEFAGPADHFARPGRRKP